jgi:hypothetical protein
MAVLEKGSVWRLARTHCLGWTVGLVKWSLAETKMVDVEVEADGVVVVGVVVEMEVEVQEPEMASRRIAWISRLRSLVYY